MHPNVVRTTHLGADDRKNYPNKNTSCTFISTVLTSSVVQALTGFDWLSVLCYVETRVM